MATIIDELIVQLSLDPSGFASGRRVAANEMRELQRLAEASINTTNVQQANLKKQFEDLAKSYGIAHNQINNLWQDLRKNSINTAASFDTATVSVKGLVSAGLEAYAAFKAVKGVIDEVARTLSQSERSFFASRYGGVSGQWLTSFQGAAYKASGIPYDQSAGFVENLRTSIESFRTPGSPGYSQMNQTLKSLNMLGINWWSTSTQGAVGSIEDYLQKLSPEQARAVAPGMGIPVGLLPHMQRGSRGAAAAEREFGGPNDEALKNAHEFEVALRGVSSQFDNLIVVIESQLTPAFKPFLENLERMLKSLQTDPEFLRNVGEAAKFLNDQMKAFVIDFNTMAKSIKDFLEFIGMIPSTKPAPTFPIEGPGAGPLGRLYGTVPPSSETGQSWFNRLRSRWRGDFGEVTAPIPSREGSSSTNAFGRVQRGHIGTATSGRGGDPRGVESALRESAIKYGFNPDDVVGVARAEGLGAANYKTWDVNNWSYGAMQMHVGGLATEYQKATGKDPSNPNNEIHMNDWAVGYAAKHGWGKWTSVTGGRARRPLLGSPGGVSTVGDSSSDRTSSSRLNRGFLVPSGTPFNSRGIPYNPDVSDPATAARVAQSMAAIKANMGNKNYYDVPGGVSQVQQAQVSSGLKVGGAVNIGDVHVHTQATDVGGIARDMSGAIRRQFLTSHANTSQE